MKTYLTLLLLLVVFSLQAQQELLQAVDSFFVACDQVKGDRAYYRIDPCAEKSYVEKIQYYYQINPDAKGEKAKEKLRYTSRKVILHIAPRDTLYFPQMIEYINKKYLPVFNPWIRKAIIYMYLDMIKEEPTLDLRTKRKLVNICLENSQITYDVFYVLKDVDAKYFDTGAKQIIREILTDGRVPWEIDSMKVIEDCYHWTDYAEESYKRYKSRVDSEKVQPYEVFVNSRVNNCITKTFSSEKWKKPKYIYISKKLLYLIGNTEMREFAPLIDSLLQNGRRGGIDKDAAALVLGHFHYKNYDSIAAVNVVQYLEKRPSDAYELFSDIQYINTQDAYFIYSSLLLLTKKISCFGISDMSTGKREAGYYVLVQLSQKIKNFPYKIKLTGSYFADDFCKVTKKYTYEDLKRAYEWMKKNKGKYIISKEEVHYP
jgi:hypothetical protein